MMRFFPVITLALILSVASACADGDDGTTSEPGATTTPLVEARPTATSQPAASPVLVDPREGGLEVGLGEWSVVLEASEIRPGEVTFVINNGGTRFHGFRVRSDSSGSGSREIDVRTELIEPGGTGELTVDLPPGVYEVDCYVEEPGVGEHDALGMETTLVVSEDAPLVEEEPPAAPASVSIEGFAFVPEEITVDAGTEVTWTNDDPTDHTVTAQEGGGFDSGNLGPGETFAFTFDQPGSYAYLCAIHPNMRGTVVAR